MCEIPFNQHFTTPIEYVLDIVNDRVRFVEYKNWHKK